jgi:hypothetical protein
MPAMESMRGRCTWATGGAGVSLQLISNKHPITYKQHCWYIFPGFRKDRKNAAKMLVRAEAGVKAPDFCAVKRKRVEWKLKLLIYC